MREIAIITGIIEVSILCGIVYGMSAFTQILKGEGVFENLCSNGTSNHTAEVDSCDDQEHMFSDIFNTSFFVFSQILV